MGRVGHTLGMRKIYVDVSVHDLVHKICNAFGRVETAPIFACRGVVSEGTGHTASGLNVVT